MLNIHEEIFSYSLPDYTDYERFKCFVNVQMSTYGGSFPFFPPEPHSILGCSLSQETDLHGLHQGNTLTLWLTANRGREGVNQQEIERISEYLFPQLPPCNVTIPMTLDQRLQFLSEGPLPNNYPLWILITIPSLCFFRTMDGDDDGYCQSQITVLSFLSFPKSYLWQIVTLLNSQIASLIVLSDNKLPKLRPTTRQTYYRKHDLEEFFIPAQDGQEGSLWAFQGLGKVVQFFLHQKTSSFLWQTNSYHGAKRDQKTFKFQSIPTNSSNSRGHLLITEILLLQRF